MFERGARRALQAIKFVLLMVSLCCLFPQPAYSCRTLEPLDRSKASAVFQGKLIKTQKVAYGTYQGKEFKEVFLTFQVVRTLRGPKRESWTVLRSQSNFDDATESLERMRFTYGDIVEVGVREDIPLDHIKRYKQFERIPRIVAGPCSGSYLLPVSERPKSAFAGWDWEKFSPQCKETSSNEQTPPIKNEVDQIVDMKDAVKKINAYVEAHKNDAKSFCGSTKMGFKDKRAVCSDGYHWSFVVLDTEFDKRGKLFLCAGVSKPTHFEEIPCIPFSGSLESFRRVAFNVQRVVDLEAERQEKVVDANRYQTEIRTKKRPNCFEGFGQNVAVSLASVTIGKPVPKKDDKIPSQGRCQLKSCDDKPCGCDLFREGWYELAACEGHEWSYLVGKGDEIRLCRGRNTLDGPRESRCVPFKKTVKQFVCASGPNNRWPREQ